GHPSPEFRTVHTDGIQNRSRQPADGDRRLPRTRETARVARQRRERELWQSMSASFLGAVTMLLVFAAVTPAYADSPQNIYTLNCWGCHRANGEGVAGTAPPLINAADFLSVPGGREYLIRVPGVSQSMLDDAD